MSTRVPWFGLGVKEIKRHIRWLVQHDKPCVGEWREALQRALRLREQRLRGKERGDRCRDLE